MASSNKRASTTAKVTKRAYDDMVAFMVANACGMILRIRGIECGAYVRDGKIMIEQAICDYELQFDSIKYYTVRKAWDRQANVGTGLPQYDLEAYRQWELSTAWAMHTDDMPAYA